MFAKAGTTHSSEAVMTTDNKFLSALNERSRGSDPASSRSHGAFVQQEEKTNTFWVSDPLPKVC